MAGKREVFGKRRDLGKGNLIKKSKGKMNENLFKKRFFVFLMAGIFLVMVMDKLATAHSGFASIDTSSEWEKVRGNKCATDTFVTKLVNKDSDYYVEAYKCSYYKFSDGHRVLWDSDEIEKGWGEYCGENYAVIGMGDNGVFCSRMKVIEGNLVKHSSAFETRMFHEGFPQWIVTRRDSQNSVWFSNNVQVEFGKTIVFVKNSSNSGINGASVSITGPDGNTSTINTNTSGHATFSLLIGTNSYSVTKSEYDSKTGSFQVVNSGTTRATIPLTASCTNDVGCNNVGDKKCKPGTTNQYLTCGEAGDGDLCLEWNTGTVCNPPSLVCSAGNCVECTSNSHCNDNNPATIDTCTNNVCSNTPTQTCTDSDNSNNPPVNKEESTKTKGYTQIGTGAKNYDKCIDGFPTNVIERYCSSATTETQGSPKCPDSYTCLDDACVSTQTCTDTDNSISPNDMKQNVAGNAYNSTTTLYDQCQTDRSRINEAWCNINKQPIYADLPCGQYQYCLSDVQGSDDRCCTDRDNDEWYLEPECNTKAHGGSTQSDCDDNPPGGGSVNPGLPPNWVCSVCNSNSEHPNEQYCSGDTRGCRQDGWYSCTPSGCTSDSQCNDNNPCNGVETCSIGSCTDPPNVDGISCNDNEYCTATDSCQGGVCTGTGNPCLAGQTCSESVPHCSGGESCTDGTKKVCLKTEGVCEGSEETCTGGEWPGCDYEDIPDYESTEESCDGELDNDCDGIEDVEDSNCEEVPEEDCNRYWASPPEQCQGYGVGDAPELTKIYCCNNDPLRPNGDQCLWIEDFCELQHTDPITGETCWTKTTSFDCSGGVATAELKYTISPSTCYVNDASCLSDGQCSKQVTCPQIVPLEFFGWMNFIATLIVIAGIYAYLTARKR